MIAGTMDDLVALCKRRGFIFQTNEIYGGMQGLYDYGPLGVELKNNLKQAWYLGKISKTDFYKNATFHKKGEVDPDNNFTFKADCYNIAISQLN